jgi:hypothetical protein
LIQNKNERTEKNRNVSALTMTYLGTNDLIHSSPLYTPKRSRIQRDERSLKKRFKASEK